MSDSARRAEWPFPAPDTSPQYVPSGTAEDFIWSVVEGPRLEHRLLILQGSRGEGKFVQHHQLLLTPQGFVKAGDVHVGETLIAVDGTQTVILGVYPQLPQPLWRLKFSDGTSLVTSDDHLWAVETGWDRVGRTKPRASRAKPFPTRDWIVPRMPRTTMKVVNTHTIRDRLQAGAWAGGGRWAIPLLQAPAALTARPVPLDPYLLGVLLGDGGFSGGSIRLASADPALVDAVRAVLPREASITHVGKSRYDYSLRGMTNIIRELGLFNHRAWEKFVPDSYLWNDSAVRLAVLQGLLDTDGTVLKHSNSVSFSTTSARLAEGVEFLVRSLGGLTKRRMRQTFYRYAGERRAGRPSYHVSVRLPNGVAPFRLARKATRIRPKGIRNAPRRYIIGCEPAGEGGGVCFQVAHPSGLYVADEAFIVTHNTTAGLMACVALAEDLRAKGAESALPVKVAVVRDTWINLQRTTLASFEENKRKGMPLEFMDGGREAAIAGSMGQELVHFWFFGLDRPDDADKLQGFTCGVYWLEEVAPAAGLATGIPDTAILGTTSVRQAGVPKRTLVTMNPPDEDHWILKVEKFLDEMSIKEVRVKRFSMAPGEKSAHFEKLAAQTSGDESAAWQMAAEEFDAYRAANQAFLQAIGRGDLEARLVRGEVGFAQVGEAVVPGFSKVLHVSKAPLPVYQGLEILRFWDSGTPNLHPAVVFAQAKPPYWLNILASRTGENVGILEFIREQVVPLQHKYGWLPPKGTKDGFAKGSRGGFRFRDIGDPACLIPEGTSSQRTVALAINEMLGTAFEPGPQDWSSRREALLAGFARPGKGDRPRMIQIDPEENDVLIRALAGRFHYPKDHATGRIVGTIAAAKRVSGIYSHTVDCCGYGLAILFPAEEWAKPPRPPKSPTSVQPTSWIGV